MWRLDSSPRPWPKSRIVLIDPLGQHDLLRASDEDVIGTVPPADNPL
jgi:hypothetical protein